MRLFVCVSAGLSVSVSLTLRQFVFLSLCYGQFVLVPKDVTLSDLKPLRQSLEIIPYTL